MPIESSDALGLDKQFELKARDSCITELSWSSTGRWLATASLDQTISLWNTHTWESVGRFRGHDQAVNSVSFAQAETLLASASDDATVRCWDVATCSQTHCFSGPTAFRSVAWDPNSQRVLSVQTKRIHLWDISKGGPPTILFEHDKWARRGLWLSSDRIISCGDDAQLIFWDASFGRPVQKELLGGKPLRDLCVLSLKTGTQIAVAASDGSVFVIQPEPVFRKMREMRFSDAGILAVATSPDGRLLSAIDNSGDLSVISIEAGSLLGRSNVFHPEKLAGRFGRLLQFHPRRPILAVAACEKLLVFTYDPVRFPARAPVRSKIPSSQVDEPVQNHRVNEPAGGLSGTRGSRNQLQENNLIFFSYSSKDRKWLNRILTILKPLVRESAVSPWDDSKIQTGNWKSQIYEAMNRAAVAVFLVSPEFLVSDFITENELPKLLSAARDRSIQVTWLMLSSAAYEISGLAEFQCYRDPNGWHTPERPLDRLRGPRLNAVLTDFCRFLADLSTQSKQ